MICPHGGGCALGFEQLALEEVFAKQTTETVLG
eukprot:SAG22_NODE_14711_length_367_cov_0.582090_1_plen_32_part_01